MGLFDELKGRLVQEKIAGIEEQAAAEAKAELEATVSRYLGDLNEAQARYVEAKAELDALTPVEAVAEPEVTPEEVVVG